jgi:hypothetical protein
MEFPLQTKGFHAGRVDRYHPLTARPFAFWWQDQLMFEPVERTGVRHGEPLFRRGAWELR